MGEPKPGSIVDNIFLSVQQIVLLQASTNFGNAGDILVRNAAGTRVWRLAVAADATVAVRLGGIMQARVDFDASTVSVPIEALSPPSYIYGIAGTGGLKPGDFVKLGTDGQTFVTAVPQTDGPLGLIVGRYSRKATDQAGNNAAIATDVVIIKLGVGA